MVTACSLLVVNASQIIILPSYLNTEQDDKINPLKINVILPAKMIQCVACLATNQNIKLWLDDLSKFVVASHSYNLLSTICQLPQTLIT